METLLNLNNTLLEVYTEQVKKLEVIKAKAEVNHNINWIPHLALNSRMFTHDEYLKNIHQRGFCFEEKNKIMPYLVQFMAEYENVSDELKNEYHALKLENEYQIYLDELLKDKFPFLDYLKLQLKELEDLRYTYRIPISPKRRNATKQLAKYRKDRAEYTKSINSVEKCRSEVIDRIKMFTELQN